MFEQHPVPQNIASYQFRLVGDMTLKQFFELASGAIVGLLIYASPLPGIIRWPAILASALIGAAFAFLPIQERPLEVWIVAFFHSIFAPTIYYWKPDASEVHYFKAEDATGAQTAQDQSGKVLEPVSTEEMELEKTEQSFLSNLTGMLGRGGHVAPQVTPAPTSGEYDFAPTPMPPQNAPAEVRPETPKETLITPSQSAVEVTPEGFEESAKGDEEADKILASLGSPVVAAGEQKKVGQALFSDAAAPPIPPTQPNVIVGQALDKNGKIIEAAILEIKDGQGRPVRALRTNKVGHFQIVTPLIEGKYQIHTEKDGFTFNTVSFEAKGEVIPPIAIIAS